MFNGCSPSGDVIIIDNINPKKSYDLTGWYIERQTDSQSLLRYTFTDKFIIPPLTTVELWSNISNDFEHKQSLESTDQQQEQFSFISINTKLLSWNTARQWSINRLFDSNGCEKAIYSHRILTAKEQEQNE